MIRLIKWVKSLFKKKYKSPYRTYYNGYYVGKLQEGYNNLGFKTQQ